jgi:hypothetical protein
LTRLAAGCDERSKNQGELHRRVITQQIESPRKVKRQGQIVVKMKSRKAEQKAANKKQGQIIAFII